MRKLSDDEYRIILSFSREDRRCSLQRRPRPTAYGDRTIDAVLARCIGLGYLNDVNEWISVTMKGYRALEQRESDRRARLTR